MRGRSLSWRDRIRHTTGQRHCRFKGLLGTSKQKGTWMLRAGNCSLQNPRSNLLLKGLLLLHTVAVYLRKGRLARSVRLCRISSDGSVTLFWMVQLSFFLDVRLGLTRDEAQARGLRPARHLEEGRGKASGGGRLIGFCVSLLASAWANYVACSCVEKSGGMYATNRRCQSRCTSSRITTSTKNDYSWWHVTIGCCCCCSRFRGVQP